MMFLTVFSVFLFAWSSLFLLDYVLRYVRPSDRYTRLAEHYGFTVSPFQMRIYTSRVNEVSLLSATSKQTSSVSRCVSVWFSVGACVSLACLVGITLYLTKLLLDELGTLGAAISPTVPVIRDSPAPVEQDAIETGGNESGLTPIIPGMNLPWTHLPVFMLVLIVAAIIHELGHSWAALNEKVRVNGFGVFVVAVYPGAFTDIDTHSLNRSSPWQRLCVFGGGVWHNLLLAGAAAGLLAAGPALIAPAYYSGHGIVATHVSPSSGLYGGGGLSPGDVVVSIDACAVSDSASWRGCVREIEGQRRGRCVSTRQVEKARASKASVSGDEVQCCGDSANATAAHLCFERERTSERQVQASTAPSLHAALGITQAASDVVVGVVREWRRELSCLSARLVTQAPVCTHTTQCSNTSAQTEEESCVFAALYNGTRLVRIEVEGADRAVLFVGHTNELLYLVELSDWRPRFWPLPYWIPTLAELFLKYVLTLSLAMGLLNALPCYALDGQHILHTAVNAALPTWPKRRRRQLISLVLFYGTSLLAANVLLGFFRFFRTFG